MPKILNEILKELAQKGNFLNVCVIDITSGLHLGAETKIDIPKEVLNIGAAAFTEMIRPAKIKYIQEYISHFEKEAPENIAFESVVISTAKTKHILVRIKKSPFYLLITMDKKNTINFEEIKPYLNELIQSLSNLI